MTQFRRHRRFELASTSSGNSAPGKTFIFLFLFFLAPVAVLGQQPIDHSHWDHVLKRYVHNGLVDYQGLLQARSELDDYLRQVEAVSVEILGEASREERLAFWINLYNASVIRMILDQYPIERFDQIPAAFGIRTIRAVDEFFSLSELRDQVLRQGFRDERVLCALVSGRMDSPRLFREAFRGEHLEDQLNRVAHVFAEDERQNHIKPGEKKIFLSPMFHTFGEDFLLNFGNPNSTSNFSATETAVISFLLQYLGDPDKRLFLDSSQYRIQYLPEDSRLNDWSKRGE